MKCLLCENYTLTQHICKTCQKRFLQPELFRRPLTDRIDVLSFYRYDELQPLILTKHTELGFHLYKLLAKLSFEKFAQKFSWENSVASIAIDDNPNKSGYAHTAILNRALKSKTIHPLYNKLRARNSVSYSTKSKIYREAHPRNFKFNNFKQKDVVLVDDIVTTGTTLKEAICTLEKHNKDVLFCLTLCDVSI